MANLATKIKLYAKSQGISNIDFTQDVKLQNDNDGKGSYIKEWNLGISQPTSEQLNSYEDSSNISESNEQVDITRRSQYGEFGEQLDEIYHNIDNWKARIKSIKDANPKE